MSERQHCEGCVGSVPSYGTQSNASPCSGIVQPQQPVLREALERVTDTAQAFLDPTNQYTHSRQHDLEQAILSARAALSHPTTSPEDKEP